EAREVAHRDPEQFPEADLVEIVEGAPDHSGGTRRPERGGRFMLKRAVMPRVPQGSGVGHDPEPFGMLPEDLGDPSRAGEGRGEDALRLRVELMEGGVGDGVMKKLEMSTGALRIGCGRQRAGP